MSFSYYNNEEAYAAFIKRKAKYKETGICNASLTDYHSLTGDISPSSPHSPFICAVCGTRFIWAAGHPEVSTIEIFYKPTLIERAIKLYRQWRKKWAKRYYCDEM